MRFLTVIIQKDFFLLFNLSNFKGIGFLYLNISSCRKLNVTIIYGQYFYFFSKSTKAKELSLINTS